MGEITTDSFADAPMAGPAPSSCPNCVEVWPVRVREAEADEREACAKTAKLAAILLGAPSALAADIALAIRAREAENGV